MKLYFALIFSIFYFIGIVSCSNSAQVSISYQTITIKADSVTNREAYRSRSGMVNNSQAILRYNKQLNTIDIFSLSSKELVKRIKAPFKLGSFIQLSGDAYLIKEFEKKEVLLVDENMNIVERYDFSQFNDSTIKFVTYGTPFILTGDFIVMQYTINVMMSQSYKYPSLCSYNMETGEFYNFAVFPESMQGGQAWFANAPLGTLNNDENLVIAYGVDHDLFVYTPKGELLERVTAKSKYVDGFKPIDMTKSRTRKTSVEYQTLRASNVNLIYDSYRKLYYKFVAHEQQLVNEDGSVNEFADNPWSIMILNEDFEILDEVLMPPGKYYYYEAYCLEDGLMIRLRDEEDRKTDNLKYDLIKIEV